MAAEVMTAPEGRIIHKTYAVLSGAAIPQRVYVTQYDESLPVIACTLYKDGQLYTIPDGASVRLRMNKNGLPVYHEAMGIDDARHVVYLEITAQMTVLYGEFAMVLEVETSDGKTAGTSYLRLIVRQNPVQNPELDNIPDYTANSNKLTAEGVKKLQDESRTQQKAIEDKGKNTLESIPEDYSTLSGKVNENTSGISHLKEDLDKLNEGGLVIKNEVIAKDINNWLDEHPEATTTVQDGAITEGKINAEFLPYIKNGYVTPEMFGAKGDGITDDTVSIKSAFDTGRDVHLMANKTYLVTETITVEKLQNFNGENSTIIFNPHNTLDAGLVITNLNPTVYTEKKFLINNISLDCNGKVNKGLCAQNIVGNIFDNIFIKGALKYGIDTNYNSNIHANNYNHITINGGGLTAIGIKGSPDSIYNSCTSIDCITGFELNDDIANDCNAWISNVDYFKGSKAFAANYGVITMNNCIIDTVETGIYVPADVIGQATNLRVINNKNVHEATTSTNIILNFAGIPKNSFFSIDNLIATSKYKASNINLNNYPNIKISNAYNSVIKDSGLHKATPLSKFDSHDCGYQCDINGICSIFFNEYQKNYTASFSYGFLPENMHPPMNFSVDKTNYSIIVGTDGNVQFDYRGTGEPVKTVGACITYIAKFYEPNIAERT